MCYIFFSKWKKYSKNKICALFVSEFLYSWVFFVRFLAFESLLILYFTLLNSNSALWNMPLTLTCSDMGEKKGTKKINSSNFCQLPQKKFKIDHIVKTKNHTKKVIHAKNDPINSILPCKFSHFWIKLHFWGAYGAQTHKYPKLRRLQTALNNMMVSESSCTSTLNLRTNIVINHKVHCHALNNESTLLKFLELF